MKSMLLTFFLLIFSIKNYAQTQEGSIISVTVEITGKGNPQYCHGCCDDKNYFSRLEITNNEDTLISFYTMSCSWEDNWISDNDSIHLYYPGCDHNYPIKITLQPKMSIVFYGIIRPDSGELRNKNFKLGFGMLSESELSDFYKDSDSAANKKIYWSNEILLDDNLYHYKMNGITEYKEW